MTDPNAQGYLVDWYAVLGLKPTASADEIGDAYRAQAKAYHPDRYAHLAKDLAAQASERFRLAAEAYAALSKPERRRAYDEEFAAWTGPVSRSGNPVIDLTGARYDPTPLFDPDGAEERHQAIERIASQMTPSDPNTFAIIERMAKERPDDPAFAAAYRSELRKRDAHLAIRESLHWEALGYRNRPIGVVIAGHLEATHEEISSLRATAETSSAAYALCLVVGAMPALTAGDAPSDDMPLADEPSAAISLQHENALQRFDQVAERVRAISAERQKVIDDRFAAIERRYEDGSPVDSLRLLFHFTVKEQSIWMAFIIQGTSIAQIESPIVGGLKEDPTPETIAEAVAGGCSVLHAVFEEDLDIKDQIHAVLLAHFERHIPEGDLREEN